MLRSSYGAAQILVDLMVLKKVGRRVLNTIIWLLCMNIYNMGLWHEKQGQRVRGASIHHVEHNKPHNQNNWTASSQLIRHQRDIDTNTYTSINFYLSNSILVTPPSLWLSPNLVALPQSGSIPWMLDGINTNSRTYCACNAYLLSLLSLVYSNYWCACLTLADQHLDFDNKWKERINEGSWRVGRAPVKYFAFVVVSTILLFFAFLSWLALWSFPLSWGVRRMNGTRKGLNHNLIIFSLLMCYGFIVSCLSLCHYFIVILLQALSSCHVFVALFFVFVDLLLFQDRLTPVSFSLSRGFLSGCCLQGKESSLPCTVQLGWGAFALLDFDGKHSSFCSILKLLICFYF